jgi:predicted ester cyclase
VHDDLDPDANAALVTRFVREVQAGADRDTFWELIHPEFVDHSRPPGISAGPQGVLEQFEAFRTVLAEFEVEIVRQVAADDLVSTYKIFSGVHAGDFIGIPASGARVQLPVSDTLRIRDGRIAEHWGVLGLAPLLAAQAAAPSAPGPLAAAGREAVR